MSKSYNTRSKNIIHKPTAKPVSYNDIHTKFYVKPNASFIATVKQIKKMLKNCEKKNLKDHISVVGMGRAVGKAISVSSHFSENHKTQVFTKTVTVLDEKITNTKTEKIEEGDEDFENDQELSASQLEKRSVSGIEIRIYIKK
ncbi:hypothetical protein ACO0RG_002816 [Hanseniaspora osmophila]